MSNARQTLSLLYNTYLKLYTFKHTTKEKGIFKTLVFIDESGYPRPTDSTMNPVLFGICIHELDIKPITNQIYKLKDSLYGIQRVWSISPPLMIRQCLRL